jgi:hypothetical protein
MADFGRGSPPKKSGGKRRYLSPCFTNGGGVVNS